MELVQVRQVFERNGASARSSERRSQLPAVGVTVLASTFSSSSVVLLRRGRRCSRSAGAAAALVVRRISGWFYFGIAAFKIPTECEWRGRNFSCRELVLHVRILLSRVAT